jgi:hypothetical protein
MRRGPEASWGSQDIRRGIPNAPYLLGTTRFAPRTGRVTRRGPRPARGVPRPAVTPFCRSVVCSPNSDPPRCRAAGFPRESRLSRGVDLLLGYVNLHGRIQLADLRQRAYGREVTPVGVVQPLLVVVALGWGHALAHAACVKALEELDLQPGEYYPLRKKPLQMTAMPRSLSGAGCPVRRAGRSG